MRWTKSYKICNIYDSSTYLCAFGLVSKFFLGEIMRYDLARRFYAFGIKIENKKSFIPNRLLSIPLFFYVESFKSRYRVGETC